MKASIFTIIIVINAIGALRMKEKQIAIRTEEEGKVDQEDIHVHYGNIDIKVINKKKKENIEKDNSNSVSNLTRNETLKEDKTNDYNKIHIKNLTLVNKIPMNSKNETNTIKEIKETPSNKTEPPIQSRDDEYTVIPRIIHSVEPNMNYQYNMNKELNQPLYNPHGQKSIVQIKKKIELPILSVIPI